MHDVTRTRKRQTLFTKVISRGLGEGPLLFRSQKGQFLLKVEISVELWLPETRLWPIPPKPWHKASLLNNIYHPPPPFPWKFMLCLCLHLYGNRGHNSHIINSANFRQFIICQKVYKLYIFSGYFVSIYLNDDDTNVSKWSDMSPCRLLF